MNQTRMKQNTTLERQQQAATNLWRKRRCKKKNELARKTMNVTNLGSGGAGSNNGDGPISTSMAKVWV